MTCSCMHYRAFHSNVGNGLWVTPAGNATNDITRAAGWKTLQAARSHVRAFRPGLYTIYNIRTIKSVERVDTRSKQ